MYINTAKMHMSSDRKGANSKIEICWSNCWIVMD